MAIPAGATIQSLTDLLQIKYQPGLTRQFNDAGPNLQFIRQNSRDITAEGDRCRIAIETGLNEAGGVHGESADIASAVSPTVRTVDVLLKQMTFRARISWRFMRKARTSLNAFARGLDLTLRSTRDAMLLTANGYTWGDGSGVVCRVLAINIGNLTLDLDRSWGITNGGQPFATIRNNQTLHILNQKGFGGATDRGTYRVNTTDVEVSDAFVRVNVTELGASDINDVAAGDFVYLQNTITGFTDTDETTDNSPPMGLTGFYDDGLVNPLQGLTIATEPFWRPHQVAGGQTTLIRDMNRAKTAAMKRAPNSRIRYLISSHESRDRWHDLLVQKAEWRNISRLDGGAFDVAVYGGRPFFADHTAPDSIIFFVPEGTLSRYNVADFVEIINDDNSTLHLVPNKTVFDILYTTLYEFGISRRNNLISVTGLTW